MSVARMFSSGARLVVAIAMISACSAGPAATAVNTPAVTQAPPTDAPFDAAAYFEGKTIRLVITSSPGGGADTVGRLIAAHLSEFIPGSPTIVPSNEERVGGMNHVYGAPPDGLTIAALGGADGSIGRQELPEAEFDMREIRMISAFAPTPTVWVMSGDLPYTDIRDAMGATEPPLIHPGSVEGPEGLQGGRLQIAFLCDRLQLPCQLLQVAEDDTEALLLMMERDEANLTDAPLNTLERMGRFADFENGTLKLFGMYDVPPGTQLDLPEGVATPPHFDDVIPESARAEWEAMLPVMTGLFTAHQWVGPDVPDEIVNALQQAMVEMMADPDVIADFAQVLQEEIGFIPGPEAETTLHDATTVFFDQREQIRALQQELWDKYWNQ